MEVTGNFAARSRKIAERFLRTAVVVDDEAYMNLAGDVPPPQKLKAPDRRSRAQMSQEGPNFGRKSGHNLDARSVIDSFAAVGVICGVVGPSPATMEMIRQADIVVLDWQLKKEDPNFSLDLFERLLIEVDRNSLRLIAFYTGEGALQDIREKVLEKLKEVNLDPVRDEKGLGIAYRHGRVVFYAKPDVMLAPHSNAINVSEGDLADRLVEEFSMLTAGLLPGIALASLTAVRECEHMVLDRFESRLDPAFLAHRVCLSDPEEAERQIVNHVAEELRGLMDNAVAGESPAGEGAVDGWVRSRYSAEKPFAFGEKRLNLEQTVVLAKNGLKASVLKENAFASLTTGFARGEAGDLDERLAWMMSFRTVFNAPPPTLWLGSVVTTELDGKDAHLLCMRPRCDSVRLDGATSFFFLPLVEDRKGRDQLVVKVGDEYRRLGIALDSAGWVIRNFLPNDGGRSITALQDDLQKDFYFEDQDGERFVWQGELKSEYAQRVAHTFAASLGRIAVDESEWLRRSTNRDRSRK